MRNRNLAIAAALAAVGPLATAFRALGGATFVLNRRRAAPAPMLSTSNTTGLGAYRKRPAGRVAADKRAARKARNRATNRRNAKGRP